MRGSLFKKTFPCHVLKLTRHGNIGAKRIFPKHLLGAHLWRPFMAPIYGAHLWRPFMAPIYGAHLWRPFITPIKVKSDFSTYFPIESRKSWDIYAFSIEKIVF
jgi:hypothetical protein